MLKLIYIQMFKYAFLLILVHFSFAKHAYSCYCGEMEPFLYNAKLADFVLKVKMIEYSKDLQYGTFVVLDKIKGDSLNDTIIIRDGWGLDCKKSINDTSKWLNKVKIVVLEGQIYNYSISSCGENVISYLDNNKVKGRITQHNRNMQNFLLNFCRIKYPYRTMRYKKLCRLITRSSA